MDTMFWGPSAWRYLDCIVMNYPENPSNNDKKNYKQFFELQQYMLPCDHCRTNFSEDLKILPLTDIDLESKNNLIKWWFQMHELTNKNLNKNYGMNINDFIDKYKPFIIKKCDSELNKCTSSDVFNSDHYILPNEYPVYQFGNTYNLTYKERNKLIDNILNDKPLNYEEELIKLNYTTNDPLDVSQQINNKRYAKIIYEDL